MASTAPTLARVKMAQHVTKLPDIVIARLDGLELTAQSVNAPKINSAMIVLKPVNAKSKTLNCVIHTMANATVSQDGVARRVTELVRSLNLESFVPFNATAETTLNAHRSTALASVHQVLLVTSASFTAQLELTVRIVHSDVNAKTTPNAILKLVSASASQAGQASSVRGRVK